jgi:predicted amino acid dehydrogenase
MKFATISHLMDKKNLEFIPENWHHGNLIISPELNINGTKGYVVALKLFPQQIMELPREEIRQIIMEAALFAQDQLGVGLFQLGALTTSVTEGGKWLVNQREFSGFVTHGDSYTAAITCQTVMKALKLFKKNSSELTIAIVGAYGIIGEAVSKILVPKFKHSILIGPREEKLRQLAKKIKGDFETTIDLLTGNADIIVTATSHPTALLKNDNLKENAIVIDVSQPPNLTHSLCKKRPDVTRIDGGYVEFPFNCPIPIPGLPPGKIYACIAEVIMQAMENEKENHMGSIELDYLRLTEKLGDKYGFVVKELTNFGKRI